MKLSLKQCLGAISAVFLVAACSDKPAPEQTQSEPKAQVETIKVGAIAGAEAQLVEVAATVAKEKFNLNVEVVTFTDYVTPNIALSDGSIDANAFQHQPYLDTMVKDRGFKIVNVANTFVYPIAAYSKKIKDISELEQGASIAIPNDPTNQGRSLILLAKQGLFTLKEDAGLNASIMDVVDNPKGFKFVELEAAQLPRSLDDVALAVINTTYASSIDLLPTRDGLFVEDKDSPYVNIIATREDNKDAQQVAQFIQSFQSEQVYQAAQELFKGSVVKGW
ncbi:methionine ABC transporter substrate-binding lipoprotein MetQ [Motilimonas eburnea]|uniref:methionine ABC transporter substrate-binding lipoprotein MetQ n=1 Tax=Motilimonas eburnea TaxID=1737488 RepID=UPI001E5497F8|nr:methionine ABC transporter substrate-binding lipoprotein MetQ [Motilimonas eburnea]MCE2570194.1 methionine ABC transporter substrate-binding lipoprotein MetQ [Motilimonas eburnea]